MVILIEPCSYFVKFFFQLRLTKKDSEITMAVLSHIFDLMLHHEKKKSNYDLSSTSSSINIPERHYPYTYRVKSFTFSSDSSPESFPPLSWKCSATSFGLSFVIVCRKQPPKRVNQHNKEILFLHLLFTGWPILTPTVSRIQSFSRPSRYKWNRRKDLTFP